MNGVCVKTGVRFDRIDKAGFRILGALDAVARQLGMDVTITCACDAHAAADPHSRGEAYDIRTHDLDEYAQKAALLRVIMLQLQDGPGDVPVTTGVGLATRHFYGQLEYPGEGNEHIHVQRRRNTVYDGPELPMIA